MNRADFAFRLGLQSYVVSDLRRLSRGVRRRPLADGIVWPRLRRYRDGRSNALRFVHHCSAGLSDRGSPKASPPARDVDDQVHDEHGRGEQVPPVERSWEAGQEQWGSRFQSRIPETTTLTVTKARIASDAKRRSLRMTHRRKPHSRANIPAIRWRRCARWTMTRPAKASPTSAWMALRMWRSCSVPSAAAARSEERRVGK